MMQFTYDGLNRLTNWNVYQSGTLVKQDSLTFDATTSNIATKSDLGNLTMSYGGSRADGSAIGPHALATIAGVPASFPTIDLNVTYTDFNKIDTLTEGNKSYTLTYGVDNQRRMSVYKEGGNIKLTRYYVGNYEEEVAPNGNVRKIHYLSGAMLVQNNGVDSLYYTYTDNQGSLIALTDASGNVVRKYAYDPWGARRNASDWTQKDNGSNLIVNRGYTGHEHLDAFNIINMNGRVYDPATGMFLSPDPVIQSPGDWVNYNRYSYCMGNPMRYTDPSGYLTYEEQQNIDRYNSMLSAQKLEQQAMADYYNSKNSMAKVMQEFAEFEAKMASDRFEKVKYSFEHGLGGPLSAGGYHFEGSAAQTAFGYLQNGYSMASATFYGTSYAVFSKGSFGYTEYAGGGINFNDPSTHAIKTSIWNGPGGSNGGGSTGGSGYQLADKFGQLMNAGGVVYGSAEMGLQALRLGNGAQIIGRAIGFGTQQTANALSGTLGVVSKVGKGLGVAGYALSAASIGLKYATGQSVSTAENVGFGISTGLVGAGWLLAGTVGAPVVAGATLIYGAGELGSYLFTGNTLEENIFGK